jgi:hypothetical protein
MVGGEGRVGVMAAPNPVSKRVRERFWRLWADRLLRSRGYPTFSFRVADHEASVTGDVTALSFLVKELLEEALKEVDDG